MIHTPHNTIAEVLQKIQAKKISIHSKTFFRMKMSAFVALLLAICFISIVLCSFIMFTIRMTGQSNFIGFGSKGSLLFFALFPWILFLFDVLLISLLVRLMRHTSFGYKIPGIYVVGIIFAIIIVSGYVVDTKTTLHRDMMQRADRKQLPFFQEAYMKIRRAPPEGYEIYRGIVLGREGDVLYIDIDAEEGISTSSSITIDVTNDPRAPHIEPGDSIFIAGKIVDGVVVDAQLKMAPRLPSRR